MHVVSRVVGFKKIKFYTNENVGSGELNLPEQQMHTSSYWLTIPSSIMASLPYGGDDRRDGVIGLAFAMRNIAQLLLMCDRHDIGLSVDGGSLERTPRTGATGGHSTCASRRAEHLHLRQLSRRHWIQPAAVRHAPAAARAHTRARCRLSVRIRVSVVRRPGRKHRATREGGGLEASRRAARDNTGTRPAGGRIASRVLLTWT